MKLLSLFLRRGVEYSKEEYNRRRIQVRKLIVIYAELFDGIISVLIDT